MTRAWPLNEGHMPPGGAGELLRVVVAEAGVLVAVAGQAVPLLASHLAGFAADADRRIGEKAFAHRTLPHEGLASALSSGTSRKYNLLVKVKEVVKLLEDDGWRLTRTRGSHRQFSHPAKPGIVTVAGKPNVD